MEKRNNFDLIAGAYDALAFIVFGRLLKRAQHTFLNQIPREGKVLIIGGGTGWILEALLKLKPKVRVVYVEASVKMLALSQKRIRDHTAVKFIHGTEYQIPDEQYDCIITNFFLDVFTPDQLTEVMGLLKSRLNEQGLWICTDFRDTGKSMHRFLIWSMHRFFSTLARLEANKLIDFRNQFSKLNLCCEQEQNYRGGLVFSSVYRIKK